MSETAKQPRHVTVATRHLVAQLDKAVAARDKAAKEVEELTAALAALGWVGDAPLFNQPKK